MRLGHGKELNPHESRTLYFDEETARKAAAMNADGLVITALEGNRVIARCDLSLVGKGHVTFGSDPNNDVVIAPESGVVSRHHGAFIVKGPSCTIVDAGSTNGLYVNGVKRKHSLFEPGDVAWVGTRELQEGEGVVLLLSYGSAPWRSFDLRSARFIALGRSLDNDIVFPSEVVSGHHARMEKGLDGRWVVSDLDSYNGTFVNMAPVVGAVPLRKGDLISITDARVVFLGDFLVINCLNDS